MKKFILITLILITFVIPQNAYAKEEYIEHKYLHTVYAEPEKPIYIEWGQAYAENPAITKYREKVQCITLINNYGEIGRYKTNNTWFDLPILPESEDAYIAFVGGSYELQNNFAIFKIYVGSDYSVPQNQVITQKSGKVYYFDINNITDPLPLGTGHKEGKANISRVQWTGDVFEFTAITSQNVREISICGDKKDDTQWHEIPYSYLKEHYGLYYVDNSDGTRTWKCRFGIHETGCRKFMLKINGHETEFIREVVLLSENSSSMIHIAPSVYVASDGYSQTVFWGDIGADYYVLWDWTRGQSYNIYEGSSFSGFPAFDIPGVYSLSVYAIFSDPYVQVQIGTTNVIVGYDYKRLYAPDGRIIISHINQIAAWQNVGWYDYPVTTIYAPDGRSVVINSSEVHKYTQVGWYTCPVMYVYDSLGNASVIASTELDYYLSCGWHNAN
ncbi:MAG: hypothetical protein IJC74_06400 [Clostridia bacterium]|nr:hypothetical protein [Clostridia bacterium]